MEQCKKLIPLQTHPACRKWKYTLSIQRLYATNYTTFIGALLPRCEGGTYKHCLCHILPFFRLQTKKSFIFLQNQNILLQLSLKATISTRQLSWAPFVFAENPETWGDKCYTVELTDTVDCGSGACVEMSVTSIKATRCFHSLREVQKHYLVWLKTESTRQNRNELSVAGRMQLQKHTTLR